MPEGLEPPASGARAWPSCSRTSPAGARVLDVGCGEGRFTSELARAGREAVGIDVAAEPLRRAREREPGGSTCASSIPHGPWPLADVSFDVVWAGEVIEHVADTAGLALGGAPRAALRW